jgi:hypothetical protein
MTRMPPVKALPDAYELAVENERRTWNALHRLKRTDVRYPEALAQWRAAADGIGIAVEVLLRFSEKIPKKKPKGRTMPVAERAQSLRLA